MTNTPNHGNETSLEQRLINLEQRLEEYDDVVAQRCLAILDVANELYQRQSERFDRLALQIDRNALAIAQLTLSIQQQTVDANADRAIMLQILQYLHNQYPGNGSKENS